MEYEIPHSVLVNGRGDTLFEVARLIIGEVGEIDGTHDVGKVIALILEELEIYASFGDIMDQARDECTYLGANVINQERPRYCGFELGGGGGDSLVLCTDFRRGN